MRLIDVRRILIQDFTGRYDLVVDSSDFADAGADFYINAGQRYLDRRVNHKKSPASVYVDMDIGEFYVVITEARAVQDVWISNAQGARVKLTKKTRQEIRQLYPMDYASIGVGTPRFYTPINVRSIPEDANSFTIDQIGDVIYSESLGGEASYNAVLILPPTDAAITVEVGGLFYTPTLINDNDINFWTEKEPVLLIQSAARMIEVSMRNRQGVNDYELAMEIDLIEMDKDDVEEEIIEIDTMGGV